MLWVLQFIIDSMMKMFIIIVEFEKTSIKLLSYWTAADGFMWFPCVCAYICMY